MRNKPYKTTPLVVWFNFGPNNATYTSYKSVQSFDLKKKCTHEIRVDVVKRRGNNQANGM